MYDCMMAVSLVFHTNGICLMIPASHWLAPSLSLLMVSLWVAAHDPTSTWRANKPDSTTNFWNLNQQRLRNAVAVDVRK